MKLSITTTTFNSERTIRDTIESVLSQDYPDYEYLIIDGGSKDKTLDIVKEYEPKFNGKLKWISEKDKGIYDAMNKGFKMSTGDVLMLINSDDLFATNTALSSIVSTFKDNPDVDCVYADLYYVAPDNTNTIIRKWRTGKQRPFNRGWLPAHPTFYVKRDIYLKYGYFNLDYKLAADFELMLRFVDAHHIKLTYLPQFLVKMRLGGATSGSLKNIYKQNLECMRAFKNNNIPYSKILYPFFRFIPKIKQLF